MLIRRALAVLLLVGVPGLATAQTTTIQTSGTLPAACTVGNIYLKTGASAGFYVCLATNTWTASGGGGCSTDCTFDSVSTGTATVTNLAAPMGLTYAVVIDDAGLLDSQAISGGASPAGSATELQYRASASMFGAITGSSVASGVVTLPTLSLGAGVKPTTGTLRVSGPTDFSIFGRNNSDASNTELFFWDGQTIAIGNDPNVTNLSVLGGASLTTPASTGINALGSSGGFSGPDGVGNNRDADLSLFSGGSTGFGESFIHFYGQTVGSAGSAPNSYFEMAQFKNDQNSGTLALLPDTWRTISGNPLTLDVTPTITNNTIVQGSVTATDFVVGSTSIVPLRGVTGSISGALTLGTCDTGTATVTGATTGMVATASPTTNPGVGVIYKAYVSAADTVTVEECGLAIVTPTATTYQVSVVR